jgi:GNAT superfamily N-acetyltransferase
VGRRLLAFVYEYAQTQGCLASELNCYLENGRAQDFRERKGYRKIAVHYQKSLGS